MGLKKYLNAAVFNVVASGITFASYPLLALMYSLESFGKFGVVNAYALIISGILSLRFDYFILSATNKYETKRYYVNSLLTILLFGFALAVFSIFYFIQTGDLTFIYIVICSVLIALFNLMNFYLVSNNNLSVLNKGKLVRAIAILLFQVMFLVTFGFENGLIFGLIAGLFTALVYLNFNKTVLTKRTSILQDIILLKRSVIKRKRDIKLQLPQALINSFLNNGFPILIEFLFGLRIAGLILIVEKFIKMPFSVLVDAIRPILISDFKVKGFNSSFLSLKRLLLYILSIGLIFNLVSYSLLNFLNLVENSPNLFEFSIFITPVLFMVLSYVFSVPFFSFLISYNLSHYLLLSEFMRLFVVLFFVFLQLELQLLTPTEFYMYVSLSVILLQLLLMLRLNKNASQ